MQGIEHPHRYSSPAHAAVNIRPHNPPDPFQHSYDRSASEIPPVSRLATTRASSHLVRSSVCTPPFVSIPAHNPASSRDHADAHGRPRLKLLLSSSDWHDETWADLLPRLLEPMGISTLRVHSGRQASAILAREPVHIAVVDLALPLEDTHADAPASRQAPTNPEGGHRLLQLLARCETPPPTVVVKRRKSMREDAREIARALSGGAFAVLERPVNLEIVLDTLRRALARHYDDRWPSNPRFPPNLA